MSAATLWGQIRTPTRDKSTMYRIDPIAHTARLKLA